MNIVNFSKKIICCALILCPLQASQARQVLDKVVAVVNGDAICQRELDNYVKLVMADMKENNSNMPAKDVLQKQILNRMVTDRIQEQLAEQHGIEVDSITVSQAIQNLAQQNRKTVEQFKRDVEARGINFDNYRELIKSELTIQRLQAREVAQDISVAKNDVESFLRSPIGQDQSGTEYKLSHILLLTPESPTPEALKRVQAQADALLAKLKAGNDFAKIAMANSAGRQALQGGDLGWRSSGEMPTLFVNQVANMKVGDVAGPIRSASGFHIIKLTDKRSSAQKERAETHVRHILLNSKNAAETLSLIRKQVLEGADFAKLAGEKSQDAHTAAKGGDMGWVTESDVLPKFNSVMSKLRNNEISEPFQTEEGWNLIQVLNRRTQGNSNEAAWNRAVEILTARKTQEALEAWTKRIRDEAHVEILLP